MKKPAGKKAPYFGKESKSEERMEKRKGKGKENPFAEKMEGVHKGKKTKKGMPPFMMKKGK